MNCDSFLEHQLKSELEDPLSLSPANLKSYDLGGCGAPRNDGSLFMDPDNEIKIEPGTFKVGEDDIKYSYEIDTAVNEDDLLICKEKANKEGSTEIYLKTGVEEEHYIHFESCKKEIREEGRGRSSSKNGGKECSQKNVHGNQEVIYAEEKHLQNSDSEKPLLSVSDPKTCMAQYTREKSFVCGQCGNQFGWKASLRAHMVIHTGEKQFICSECGRAFARKSFLWSHFKTHTGEKPFMCSYCGKAFSHKNTLSRHLRIHSVRKPFKCSDCGKEFSDKTIFNSHLRIHNGEEPFKCSYCGKAFCQQGHLSTHLRIHTGEKPFKCNDCGKAFSQKNSLLNHFRTHTGEKPFKCHDCGKTFSIKVNLNSHLRTHTGEKPFKCNGCGKAFSQKSNYNTHLMRRHTENKP